MTEEVLCIDCSCFSPSTDKCYNFEARLANRIRGKVLDFIPPYWENRKNNCKYFEDKYGE